MHLRNFILFSNIDSFRFALGIVPSEGPQSNNEDGLLPIEELKEASGDVGTRYAEYDGNGDGFLSEAEYVAAVAGEEAGRRALPAVPARPGHGRSRRRGR